MQDDIRPQQGPQEAFLATPADVAFYGGAAGGGRTIGYIIGGSPTAGVAKSTTLKVTD